MIPKDQGGGGYPANWNPVDVALLAVHELLYAFVGALYLAANRERGPEDVPGGDWTDEFLMSHGGQAHRGDATASGTVGVTPKLAGLDSSLEICGERTRGLGEDAAVGRRGRREEFPDHPFLHVEFGLMLSKAKKRFDHTPALGGGEAFDIGGAALGCEGTHPDFFHGRVGRPEIDELGEVAATLHHRAGDSAMDRYMLPLNVAQNTLVGGGLAARVVFGLQAVDRDH